MSTMLQRKHRGNCLFSSSPSLSRESALLTKGKPLIGEFGLGLIERIDGEQDLSLLASSFRRALSNRLPKDVVQLLVRLLDPVDLLALACVSKDCLALAKALAMQMVQVDLREVAAVVAGHELVLSDSGGGHVVLFRCSFLLFPHLFPQTKNRDGTFSIYSHGASYASMGQWNWDACLLGTWKRKADSDLLDFPKGRFAKEILLQATSWNSRFRGGFLLCFEHKVSCF